MNIVPVAEKKSRIVAIISECTRDNLAAAFNQSLVPSLEAMMGLPADQLPEFTAIMDKAMPKIGAVMSELFNQELIAQLVQPTLEVYSDQEVEQVYQMVSNPMYKRFMSEVTVGMVQSPAYMGAVMQIGPKVEEILQSVWEELNPAKEDAVQAANNLSHEALVEAANEAKLLA